MPKQLLLPKWQLYTKKEGRNLLFQSHFPDSKIVTRHNNRSSASEIRTPE